VVREEKINEMSAIPDLLDRLEVAGDTIMTDAVDCNPRGVSGR
jgi:predicted transposase YbfD/YdcC